MKRAVVTAIIAVAIVAGVGGVLSYNSRPAALSARVLQIDRLPASARSVRCESWGVTDTLTTCALDIGPDDFSRLLEGAEWARTPASGSSFTYASGPRLGEAFSVANKYAAKPRGASGEGHLILVTNASRTRAQVDLYIE